MKELSRIDRGKTWSEAESWASSVLDRWDDMWGRGLGLPAVCAVSAASFCHNTLPLTTKTRWHTSVAAGRARLPGGDSPACLSYHLLCCCGGCTACFVCLWGHVWASARMCTCKTVTGGGFSIGKAWFQTKKLFSDNSFFFLYSALYSSTHINELSPVCSFP